MVEFILWKIKVKNCSDRISYPLVDKNSPYNAEIEDRISKRDKCFNIVFNDKDDKEMEKLKADGRWIFPEKTDDDAQNNTKNGSKRIFININKEFDYDSS